VILGDGLYGHKKPSGRGRLFFEVKSAEKRRIMDFQLTEDQKMLQQTLREFAEAELRPQAAEIDKTGAFPKEQLKKMAELGLMGMGIPTEFGGAGMDAVSYAIAVEEVAWGDASCSVIMSVNNSLVCEALYKLGSEKIKKEILPPLARGEEIGCFCLTEAEAGSDAAAQSTRAEKKGDHYVITGSKMFITSGGQAKKALVMAVTDASKGKKGISSFIVDCDSEGLSFGPPEKKLGLHGSHTTEMFLNEVAVPADRLIGQEGDGLKIALITLDSGRIGIGAQALGIGRAAYDASVKYAKERKQFGQTLSQFQAIQFKIADMATRLDASRLLVWRAGQAKSIQKRFSREAAMAKLFASETCNFCCDQAIQIHGGYGYISEYPVERFYRDGRITELYEGTSEIQRMVIARAAFDA
jgi:alkylation response protein AidB-like acyl-CoA dehydrogenase